MSSAGLALHSCVVFRLVLLVLCKQSTTIQIETSAADGTRTSSLNSGDECIAALTAVNFRHSSIHAVPCSVPVIVQPVMHTKITV